MLSFPVLGGIRCGAMTACNQEGELRGDSDEMHLRRPVLKGATRAGKGKIFLASLKRLSLGTNWTRCIRTMVSVEECCARGMKSPKNVTVLNTAIRVNNFLARQQRATGKLGTRDYSGVGRIFHCDGAPPGLTVGSRRCAGGSGTVPSRAAGSTKDVNFGARPPAKMATGTRECAVGGKGFPSRAISSVGSVDFRDNPPTKRAAGLRKCADGKEKSPGGPPRRNFLLNRRNFLLNKISGVEEGNTAKRRVSGSLPRADAPVGPGIGSALLPGMVKAAATWADGDGCLSFLSRCRKTNWKLQHEVAGQGERPGMNSALQTGFPIELRRRESEKERSLEGELTVFEKRWQYMYGSAGRVGEGKVVTSADRPRKRAKRRGKERPPRWKVSETERQICDLRRNVTRADRRLCARSMAMTEAKFMVVFEEAIRRARKEIREIERFELQMRDALRILMEMKLSLGEWKEEEIEYNRPTIMKNIMTLDGDDMNSLRRLYNKDDFVFMGRKCQGGEDKGVSDGCCEGTGPSLLTSNNPKSPWRKKVHDWVHCVTGWIYGSRAVS